MKNISFLLCILFCGLTTIAQTDKNWLISIDFGIQAHDKRLYHWPEFPARHLLESQPENFGTYQVGINISRKIIEQNKFSTYVGIGISTELATFLRPFDHLYKIGIGDFITRYTERYTKRLIQLPIQSKYYFSKKWSVTLGLLPQFNIQTIAHTDNTVYTNFSWKEFSLYSIELNPGIEYVKGKLNFGMKFRAFQLKKIDPIIFYSTSSFTMGNEKNETYNPFKLWFSMGYEF